MTRTCRQIVADHRCHYPHQVKLADAGGWRDRHCAHKAREIMSGPLIQWFEGPDNDRRWVYGFQAAEEAAAFRALLGGCGIDLERAAERAATGDARGPRCTASPPSPSAG